MASTDIAPVAVPVIDGPAVAHALSGLTYQAVAGKPNPLENLLLVEQRIAVPAAPRSSQLRRIALQTLLVDLIVTCFNDSRTANGLGAAEPNDVYSAALTDIERLARLSNPMLIGWALLYYRYVRADLDISVALFSRMSTIHQRTLQRYQEHAESLLTSYLIELEWKCRHTQRQRWLYTQLPITVPTTLIGREQEARLLDEARQTQLRHLQIIGPSGVGKTTFVQEMIRRQIDADSLDSVVWIDHPASIAQVWSTLDTVLLPYSYGLQSLREVLMTQRVTLIMDGCSALRKDLTTFEWLLAEIAGATAYLIDESYLPLSVVTGRVQIEPLTPLSAKALIDRLLALNYPEVGGFSEADIEAVWLVAGGLPASIVHLVQDFHRVIS